MPLDVSRKLVLSPADLAQLPAPESRAGKFLGQVVPHAIAPTASLYGVEGVYLNDVVGLAALTLPGAVSTRPIVADVETRGELTRGMSVFDTRWSCTEKPNVDLAVGVDLQGVREYVHRVLGQAGSA